MLRIQATIGLNTYYFASEALDYDNRYWEPRISNAFQISRNFSVSDKSGNKIRTMDVQLDNRDGYFNSIEAADGLLNSKFTMYFNEGDDVVKKFTGRVTKINSYGEDISLNIREVGYEYLKEKFPDAQIAYDYYSTSGINDSWNAIPIHFGTVNRYPTPWVNLFYSDFIIGSGPVFKISKIYFDKVTVYDESTGTNGYKPTPTSKTIKFRVYKGIGSTGSPEVVGGVESRYPGFAYIQLYDEATGDPINPTTPDGEVSQIYVDLEGIVNAGGTAAERNPAQILYNLFTKPYTGYEGYGLGVSASDLDFADAITECTIQGFKIDGSIDNTTEFGEWIDEILRCCRGQLREDDGVISIKIDSAPSAASVHFDETGEIGYDCNVETWNEPDRDSQTNRVKLSYSWNFENNTFNKKPDANEESPLGDTNLIDEAHALRLGGGIIPKYNTETLEYKLIKDDTTAHKLAQYYLKSITKQLKKTSLTTEVNIPDLDAGTVVKVTSPKFGWSEKQFRITNISRLEEYTELELQEYSSDIFTFVDPGTGAETSGQLYSVYNIPAKPEMTSLEVTNEQLVDGTTQTKVNVNFIAPVDNAQFIALYYKLTSETEADFKPLGMELATVGNMSLLWKGIEVGNYNFRLVTISAVGIYSDLSVEAGDKHYYGQPNAESYQAMTGDTVPPGTPIITDYLLVQGGVTLSFDITGGIPSDFSHFAVYRTLNGGSRTLIDAKYTGKIFTDTDTAGYVPRLYTILAYDKTGNVSDESIPTPELTPLKVVSDDITTNQIISKDFRTALDVGETVDGVRFTADGIEMWQDGSRKVFIPVTGDPEFYGLITAAAGFIGGWEIFPTYLQSNNIRLDSAGIIQTLDFLSGIKGWKVNETGDAEFNNIRARGAVKTVVFEKDEISVVGGRTLIRPAGLITSNYTDWLNKSTEAYFEDCWTLLNSILGESNPYIPEVFANYQEYYDAELLYFNTLNEVLAPDPSPEFEPFIGNVGVVITTENADQFNVGDFIRIKDGLSNDFWGEVTDKSGDDLTVEVKYGDLFNITAGQIIVNYGIAGSGGILLDGQTPLIDVYTHNGMPWLETDIKVRIGNLNGWGDIVSDVYGIAIGNASGEYLIYDSTSSRLRIKGAIVLGADSSVDGTYIDDDSIETRHLQAGSVTADIVDATVVKTTELQVYGKNRCIDPAFDGVPYSATFTNPGFSSVGSRLGKWEIVVQTGSINSYGYHKLSTSIGSVASDNGANAMGWAIGLTDKTATIACKSDAFAVNPSTPYHLSICTHNGTGRVPTGTLKAEWYTSSGSLISTSTIATFNPTATPTRRGGSATSPATAAICRVRIELAADATNGGGALIFSAAQVEEGATATAWVNREQGTVTADRIVTGQVKSLNYSTTTGSLLDIDNGNFTVGGSTAPVFALNAIAKTGQLSGFSFNVTDMTAGSTTNAIGISTDTDKKAFWAGSETPADGKFFVGHDGFLHAEYGAISGFTITATDLTAGSGSSAIGISTDAAKKAFWAGDETPADAPFFVNNDGSGLIAGFEFNGTDLTSGTGSTAIGISTDPAKKAFWAGNETPADAPFFVNSDGTGKIGLLTFTSSLIAHYSLDKNYHPLDPAHLVRTFAIAPNLDGWKGAAMQFVDDYNDSGVYLDTTLLSFGAFAGEALALEPYSTKTKSTAMLRLAATSSQYAIVTGGIIEGYISNLSDKNIKKDFTKTNTLHKLMQLDVSEWSYDDEAIARKEYEKQVEQAIRRNKPMPIKKQGGFVLERGHRHIGPTAKEFNELFGVSGGNPESIGVGDQIGVTMRAIQELAAIVFEQANEIAELRKALKLPEKQQKTGDADEYFLLTDEEQD